MPVKKDPSGRRSIEAQTEVPGTPEEVWRAIATGPGISSWFVPSRVEERVGGAAVSTFGPGMDATATITAWDPPHRFAFESKNEMDPNSPPVATEWLVESRAGGTCIVRVVHRWFADTDDWDSHFESMETGWPCFFRILRIYLAHYAGLPSAGVQALSMTSESVANTWTSVMKDLGLSDAAEGRHVKTHAPAPLLGGSVERLGPPNDPELLVKLDQPAPGAAHLFVMPMGPQTCVSLRVFFYGDSATLMAAREDPRWQAWMNEKFPATGNEDVVAQGAS
jgi:uncharacterized protein YndB with AHSA1/START domain